MGTGFLIILVIAIPALMVFVTYYEWNTPTMDFYLDAPGSSTVHYIIERGKADMAGLEPGDVLLTVDGVAFENWWFPEIPRTHDVKLERRGAILSLQIPAVRLVTLNYLAFISALLVALSYWGIATLLLIRRFWNLEIRVLYVLATCIGALALIIFSFQFPWNPPVELMPIARACFCLIPAIILHYVISAPIKLGDGFKRVSWLTILYGSAVCILLYWLFDLPWYRQIVSVYISLVTSLTVAMMTYVYRYRTSIEQRRRTRVVTFGALVAVAFPILFHLIPKALNSPIYLPEWMAVLSLIAAPISYLYATQHFNLFGIDRIINRTLVYAFLSSGIFAVYLIPYVFIFQNIPDDSFIQIFTFFLLTLWIGWTFNGIRSGIQRRVDKLFYGSWYDYPSVIENISNKLARSTTREQIHDILTNQVPKIMRIKEAGLWIRSQNDGLPSIPRMDTHFRYIFQTAIPAQWTVESHSDGDDLSNVDIRILNTISQQAEIALNNALTIETLRNQLDEIKASQDALNQTQRQLLRSREDERARLARDLHDSPIQALVGMNIQIGLLINNKDLDPLLTESLTEMRTEIRQLSNELRQVCADLRPPMLDAIGLSAALKSLFMEWATQNSIQVTCDLCADAVLRSLPGEVSVNLYRVAQEALVNIGKHAKAKNVSISLAWQERKLFMIIKDDGMGFSAPDTLHGLTSRGHFGLVGMRERVNLIGGTWMIDSKPGSGTTITITWQNEEKAAR